MKRGRKRRPPCLPPRPLLLLLLCCCGGGEKQRVDRKTGAKSLHEYMWTRPTCPRNIYRHTQIPNNAKWERGPANMHAHVHTHAHRHDAAISAKPPRTHTQTHAHVQNPSVNTLNFHHRTALFLHPSLLPPLTPQKPSHPVPVSAIRLVYVRVTVFPAHSWRGPY